MRPLYWLILVGVLNSGFAVQPSAIKQPQIYAEENNLHVEVPENKFLRFKAAQIFFNHVDVLPTLLLGSTCETDINECARFVGTDLGCQNGATCMNLPGTYQCQCINGWIGTHCNRKSTDCYSGGLDICGHGTCVPQNNQDGYKCLCDAGWTNDAPSKPCTTDVDECSQKHPPCSTNPLVQCINLPGSYMCQHCPPGYTGNGYYCADINECELFNGGCSVTPFVECINTPGSNKCGLCPPGYQGDGKTCTYKGICHVNNGGCHYLAICSNPAMGDTYVQCTCPQGYTGSGIGPAGCTPAPLSVTGACASNPCLHGTCIPTNSTQGFVCVCMEQYSGNLCDRKIDPCNPNPCLNGGTCTVQRARRFICSCLGGFYGRICQNERQACIDHISQTNGTVRYPPDDYDVVRSGDRNCAWRISTDENKVMQVTFTKFSFSDTPPCSKQFLEVHDGKDFLAQSLGRFCGTTLPLNGTVTTTHNSIYFWVHSTKRNIPLVELSWISKSPECGGALDGGRGLISSPGWPNNYPNNRNCYWTFRVPSNKRLLFHVFELNIGDNSDCSKDYLEFLAKSNTQRTFAKFCNSTIPEPFYSVSSEGTIHFRSDSQGAYSGFQIVYSIVDGIPGCGGVYSSLEGYLQSIELTSSMPNPLICSYQIKLPVNTSISLEFTEMQLDDNCENTHVDIYLDTPSTSVLLLRRCGSLLSEPLLTHGSDLTVKSLARYNFRNRWKLKYQALCEEVYTEPSKSFTSPSNRTNCRHLISQPPGWIIFLDLEVLDSGSRPVGAEVKIFDGDSESATLFGTYHGNEKAKLVSSTNYLLITVNFQPHPFIPVPADLISGSYRTTNLGCGELLKQDLGTISYPPEKDNNYGSNKSCRWVIRAPTEKVIQLTWMAFNLEQSYDCAYDHVKVFDNNTDTGVGHLLGVFCGHKTPPFILSTSNVITLDFMSDNTIGGEGFILSYTFIKSSSVCGGNYRTPAGVIKTPEYPNNYPPNKECIWTITVPPGSQIMLQVKNFSLEAYAGCRYDWLEIRNGAGSSSPLIGKYCGNTIPKRIPSHANQIYLRFNSDMSRTSTGFVIEWSSTSTGCGGSLNSPSGSIISPQYPEPYSKNADCIWSINVNHGSRIQIVFADVDLETHATCQMDYIELYDGSITSKSIGRYCTPQTDVVTSTSNQMTVRFRSDVSFQGRGFQLRYLIVCKNVLNGFSGVIESPNFPNEYPKDQDCVWEIVVPQGNKINISFSDFSLEENSVYENDLTSPCSFDYIEIAQAENTNYYEDDSDIWKTVGKYCGSKDPGLIALNSSHAKIHFVSDSLLIGTGFRLEWQINGCGGYIRETAYGTITSPNYPKPYPNNIECLWRIEVTFGEAVDITFNQLNIERDSSCSFDYIEIFNGPSDDYPLLTRFCHQALPTTVISSGNNMYIRFKADHSFEGDGFIAYYRSSSNSCDGDYVAPSGYIYSPNYPKNFNRNQTCQYIISTDSHHLINFRFIDVDLIPTANCSTNYIKVYDGPSQAYPVLKTICGGTNIKILNETIRSSTEHLLVEFTSNSVLTSKGFKAYYEKACGARINTSSTGTIDIKRELRTEVNADGEDVSNCSFTILADDPKNHVTLTIQKLEVDYCGESGKGLKIFNGPFNNSPLLGEYCSSKVPPPLISDGPALHIQITEPMNFQATYSVLDSECGGELISPDGYIATPGYPKSYPMNTECTWTMNVGRGHTINLIFKNLDIPESPNCNLDFLEIREGWNGYGKLLGVFCGATKPNDILSAIGSMQLIFRSTTFEGTSMNKGFLVEYTTNKENNLRGSEGTIESQASQVTGSFTWLITTNASTVIALTINSLNLGIFSSYNECLGNILRIYDGMDEEAPVLKELCSYSEGETVLSTSNMMFIRVDIFTIRTEIKYLMTWKELARKTGKITATNTTSSGCQTSYNLDKTEVVTISSPGYPYGYKSNLKCEWILETPEQYHLTLKFVDVNFGYFNTFRICTYTDSVSVYTKQGSTEQWKLLKEICNRGVSTEEKLQGSNWMKVAFKSNSFLNGTGFQAIVKRECGGTLTGSMGFIQIDNKSTAECQWNITVKVGRTIRLTFEKFDLGTNEGNNCPNYLIIRNGMFPDSPYLEKGKFCGSDPPPVMESVSNHLYLKYSGSTVVEGFKVKYEEVSMDCNRNIQLDVDEPYVVITTPNYPNIPQAHIECVWRIRAPPGESLRIDFEERFDIDPDNYGCTKDYVELRDGGTELSDLIARECREPPSSKSTKGNLLRVKYHTDSSEPRNGFKANVTINSCGGTFRQSLGTLNSKLYTIKPGSSCTWWIRTTRGSAVGLHFSDFHVGSSGYNCTADDVPKVKLYNVDFTGKSVEEKILCGNLGNETSVRLSTSTIQVVFEPKSLNDRFTFTFEAQREDCGGTLDQESATITTPGYPQSRSLSISCFWKITVSQGRRITFFADDVDIGDTTMFTMFDGRRNGIKLADQTNLQTGKTYETSSNEAIIFFYQERSSYKRGIKLTYTSDKPSICVGDLDDISGEIRSPNVSHPFTCEYAHVKSSNEETLAMKIMVSSNVSNKFDTGQCNTLESKLIIQNAGFDITQICYDTENHNRLIRSTWKRTILQAFSYESQPLNYVIQYNTYNCGGQYEQDMGVITSPNFPKLPTQPLQCAWVINVADYGSRIKVNFTTFDPLDCDKSYIKIFNGPTITSPMIGKYCKGFEIKPFITQVSQMLVEYQYEMVENDKAKGFSFTFEAKSEGCGGIYLLEFAVIKSPNYDNGGYGNNQECTWDIIGEEGYVVELTFLSRFFIEDSVNCTNDYIEILDRVDDEWVSFGKKCGRTFPEKMTSTSNELRIIFRSNEAVTGKGFQAYSIWKCGATFYATETEKYVTGPVSRNNIRYFLGNYNCTYKILTKKPQGVVSVNIKTFSSRSIACSSTNLTVKSLVGSSPFMRQTFCFDQVPLRPQRFKQGVLVTFSIVMSSDTYAVRYKLTYKDDSCGGNINSPSRLEIPSPDTGPRTFSQLRMYQPRISCSWNITAPKDQIVVFIVHELNMMGLTCTTQSANVYDGLEAKSLKRIIQFCGKITESKPVTSSSSSMLVTVDTSPHFFGGMQAEVYFTYGPAAGCGGTINLTDTRQIHVPYNLPHMDCHWTIQAPQDYKVEVEFDDISFSTSCQNFVRNHTLNSTTLTNYCTCSYVEIRDGGSPFAELVSKLCYGDSTIKRIFTTSYNTAYIRLYSAVPHNVILELTIRPLESNCGPSHLTATKELKELTSPNYPNAYPPNTQCHWVITNPVKNKRIVIFFEKFDLQGNSSQEQCDSDMLELKEDSNERIISEGFGPNARHTNNKGSIDRPDRFIFCGNDSVPFDYYSVGSEAILNFRSFKTSGKKEAGFKLKYGVTGCNRTIRANEGRIQSDQVDIESSNCTITVISSPNTSLSIYFLQFFFISANDHSCGETGLEIRERDSMGPEIFKGCGFRVPTPVFSNVNKLVIRTYNIVERRRYFRYNLIFMSSPKGRGCGGKLFNYVGTFSSPLYPKPLREDIECTWEVSVPKGYNVALVFRVFNIGGGCAKNKVVVTTYSDVGPTDITYCQDDNTSAVLYSKNYVKVKYYSTVNNGGTGWTANFKAVSDESQFLTWYS